MKRLRNFRPVATRAAFASLLTLFVYGFLSLVRWFSFGGSPLSTNLDVAGVWLVSFVLVSALIWSWKRFLWSLRNQMAVAYVFIAVVPLLLVLTMVGLGAYLLYWQLGSYVLNSELQTRVQRASTVAGGLATTLAIESATTGRPVTSLSVPEQNQGFVQAAKTDIPGLQIEIGAGQDLLAQTKSTEAAGFRGVVFTGKELAIRAVAVRQDAGGSKVYVSVSVPITPALLETLTPDLGPLRLLVMQPVKKNDNRPGRVSLNGQKLVVVYPSVVTRRPEPPAAGIFDKLINGVTTLNLVDLRQDKPANVNALLDGTFLTRPSVLNRRLFGSLGYLGSTAVGMLKIVGIIFLLLELAALTMGILLSRSITNAVDNLYFATQHVQSGDLSFRVKVQNRDELGSLGDSFNSMMHSIGTLIDEQRERQRLENELNIAREVQTQLFPPELPSMPGIELEAICRPARMVSGDYYDFIRIGPTRLAIVLADISGKGISAALLMASLQATLRGELLRNGEADTSETALNTAEIVERLNRHMYHSTSEERYATLFLAIYDTQSRQLSYTNAGHLPPLYVAGGKTQRLETGDTVIGLFSDVHFRQITVDVAGEGLLVIYSDGLTEPENGNGDAFGSDRLAEIVFRLQHEPAKTVAQSLLRASAEWGGSREQADDMTVVVARLAGSPTGNVIDQNSAPEAIVKS